MKRAGRILICLLAAALLGYLMLWDYPSYLKSLSPDQTAEETIQTAEPTQSPEDSEQPTSVEETPAAMPTADVQETDTEAIQAEIPATQTILLIGSIREEVYTDLAPLFSEAGYPGTLLFDNSHLAGDTAQMSVTELQELLNAGCESALGGLGEDLSADDWSEQLSSELEQLRQRSSVRPTSYYFRAGEYTPELEEVLKDEGFTVLYYSPEDADKLSDDADALKHIPYLSMTEDTDLEALLDEAWSYDSVVLTDASEDETAAINQWIELLSLLDTDDRFTLTTQSNWLDTEQQTTPDRAALVASVQGTE